MRAHIGFDIGTTNTKCLVLGENGEILDVIRKSTPKVMHNGIMFFDIPELEAFVDASVSELMGMYQIASIGFSTIGESVVPVRNRKALCNAPLWNERSVTSSAEEKAFIDSIAAAERIGTASNPLFSIHKILWMKRNIEEASSAEFFLPLSSYFCYRKTGVAAWDYSQAARSSAFDVRSRKWITELSDAFSIRLPEKILPMGSSLGECDGIVYGLGGHDHIVGFFAIEKILSSSQKAIYYSSMGTSEVMATIVPSDRVREISPSRKSYISPSFTESSYIATRSFRSFGSMLQKVMAITGYGNDYERMNSDIRSLRSSSASCLFLQDGDFISDALSPGKLYASEISDGSDSFSFAESAYLYLSAVSELMRSDLESAFSMNSEYVFAAGGGITDNTLFMEYLASALGHPVDLLVTEEISALGAALTGISAYSAAELQRISSLFRVRRVYPDERLIKLLKDTAERYREIRK